MTKGVKGFQKGYRQTEEAKKRIGLINSIKMSEKWKDSGYRNHMSEIHKGQKSWSKGKKLGPNPEHSARMKGRKHTEETKHKMSLAKKGKIPQNINQIKGWNKDKIGWISDEGRKRISEAMSARVLRGEKSSLWKGGVMKNYPKLFQERLNPEYKSIMRMTKERDDFRCLWCGERGKELHSDHILPFIDYPQFRLELNNIQTLCVDCHKIKTKGDRTGIYIFA